MIPPDWILDDATAIGVVACTDPAESLARHARVLGLAAMDAFTTDTDAAAWEWYGVQYARAAWRFASAALVLADVALLRAAADDAARARDHARPLALHRDEGV